MAGSYHKAHSDERFSKEWLEKQYVRKGRSSVDIALELDVSAQGVRYWLKKHGIRRRTNAEVHFVGCDERLSSRKWLSKKYEDEGLTCGEIGKLVGRSEAAVRRRLYEHGIELRDAKVTEGDVGLNRGREFSDEWRQKLSENHRDCSGRKNPQFGKPPSPKTSRGRNGLREDLGHHCRSSWEANFARSLMAFGLEYEYEPRSFDLGDTTYTPDFWIPDLGVFVEVSGYTNNEKARKVADVVEQYGVKVVLVERPVYETVVYLAKALGVELEPDRVAA